MEYPEHEDLYPVGFFSEATFEASVVRLLVVFRGGHISADELAYQLQGAAVEFGIDLNPSN